MCCCCCYNSKSRFDQIDILETQPYNEFSWKAALIPSSLPSSFRFIKTAIMIHISHPSNYRHHSSTCRLQSTDFHGAKYLLWSVFDFCLQSQSWITHLGFLIGVKKRRDANDYKIVWIGLIDWVVGIVPLYEITGTYWCCGIQTWLICLCK